MKIIDEMYTLNRDKVYNVFQQKAQVYIKIPNIRVIFNDNICTLMVHGKINRDFESIHKFISHMKRRYASGKKLYLNSEVIY